MGKRATLLLILLVLCYGVTMAMGFYREEQEEEEEYWRGGEDLFLLQDSKHVVKTDAGEMRVVRSAGGRIIDRPMHIGFIIMEPKSLFVPQYLDSSIILFIRRGQAKVGLIYRDELSERQLKVGDIYRIPAGSAFYLVNTEEGQKLHIICSIDPSESLGFSTFQSFFIGGGTNPISILAGFEIDTLSTALNVTTREVKDIMTRQKGGPIIYLEDSRSQRTSVWSKFLQMKEQDRLQHLKRMLEFQQEPIQDEEEKTTWSWRKLLNPVFGQENRQKGEKPGKSPDSYNLFNRRADFKNSYGWSVALDESDYKPLKHSGIGVYLVNLTAGSMMAPHVNPTATEYGIVLRGSGTIQIVFPNGTQAMNAKVSEGNVFMVPRYFAFCQIASRSSPFEFFGFTTSASKNRPQFLVGANSVLETMKGPELAAAFGMTDEERARRFIDAQRESVILPSAGAAASDKKEEEDVKTELENVGKLMRGFGNDMIMGFD